MIAGEKHCMRWLRNGVLGVSDIFEVQNPVELEALIVWYLVAQGIVTIDGDDESTNERLDRSGAIPSALGVLQSYISRGQTFCGCLCNVTLQCVRDTNK